MHGWCGSGRAGDRRSYPDQATLPEIGGRTGDEPGFGPSASSPASAHMFDHSGPSVIAFIVSGGEFSYTFAEEGFLRCLVVRSSIPLV